jgi:hypothetical protein
MTTKDHDTDPSTPSARRSAPPLRANDGTDPGVGPPTEIVRKDTPLNIVVPSPQAQVQAQVGLAGQGESAAVGVGGGQKKDSVELLLEGIAGPRPGRARTTPQSAGEASAVYHAEHSVHRGQAPLEEASKVLVERPPTPREIPLTASVRRMASLNPGPRSSDPTVVTRDDLRRRLILAFVAGLLVVLGLFLVLRLTSSRAPDETPSLVVSASAAIAAPPAGAAASAAIAPASSDVVADPPPAPETSHAVASAAPAPVPEKPARNGHRRHASGSGAPAASSSTDLGEFKTKF